MKINLRQVVVSFSIICVLFCLTIMSLFANNDEQHFSSFATASHAFPFSKSSLYVVSLGDSLTRGTGDQENKDGYVGRLAEKWQSHVETIEVANFAVKGQRSDKLLKQLRKKEIQQAIKKADVILLTIGANDFLKLVKKKKKNFQLREINDAFANYMQNLKQIVATLESLNSEAAIVFIGLYNPIGILVDEAKQTDALVQHFNQISEEIIMTSPNGHFIPIHDIFLHKSVHLLADDYFHPNGLGYERIAERIDAYFLDGKGRNET